MTPTRAQIESWESSVAHCYCRRLDCPGQQGGRSLSSRYLSSVTTVHGAYWEGEDRGSGSGQGRRRQEDGWRGCRCYRSSGKNRTARLSRDRRSLAAGPNGCSCSRSGWICGLGRASAHGHRGRTGPPPRIALMVERQRELTDAANATEKCRTTLCEARWPAPVTGYVWTFVSAVTSGGEQGKSDSDALATHPASMTPETIAADHGNRPPDTGTGYGRWSGVKLRQSRRRRWNTSISWEDHWMGNRPRRSKTCSRSCRPDAQAAVANSLQILSNENVSATVEGDPDVPTKGGLNLLPDMMRESLTRDDLVVNSFEVAGGSGLPSIALNGVADNQAIADIVSMGRQSVQKR